MASRKPIFQNLSVNLTQLFINQVCGLLIFYLLSTHLDKHTFGQLNLALAILLMIFNLLALGIDQIAIRKIASGYNAGAVLGLYLCHVILTGLLFYGLLLLGGLVMSANNGFYQLLVLIGIGKLGIYFSTPFKQAANGLERFGLLATMLVISNVFRSALLVVLILFFNLNLKSTVIVFVAGDLTELTACAFLFYRRVKMPVVIKWHKMRYLSLLRESMPQMGVAVLSSALARLDWIFVGFMISAVKLAEYSFAYKVFEIATLPLLAIAPLLIPWLTRSTKQANLDVEKLKFLLRIEMMVAAFTFLIINLVWAPLIDGVTGGRYGLVNVLTTFILTLSIPLLYLNNLLWTIYFANGRMKMILKGFFITFLANTGLNLLLIPLFRTEGAAASFLIAMIVQSIFYISHNTLAGFTRLWKDLVICMCCALTSGFIAKQSFHNVYATVPTSVILFALLLIATGQIKLKFPIARHTSFGL